MSASNCAHAVLTSGFGVVMRSSSRSRYIATVRLMTRRGVLLFAAMSLIWGIPYLFIRIAVGELTPATLVFLRTGVAALLLLPIAVRWGGMRVLLGKWRQLIVFALIEIGIAWFALSSAEQHISSSLAGLLISAVPLVGVVIAPAFATRERIGPVNMAGLLLRVPRGGPTLRFGPLAPRLLAPPAQA